MEKKIKLFDGNLQNSQGSRVSGVSLNLPSPVEWSKHDLEYDVAVYTDSMAFSQQIDHSKINCIWLLEPPIINGEHLARAVNNHKNFKYIFSFIKDLQNRIDNFVYIPAGGTWLRQEDMGIHNKTKNISTIFSWKKWNYGHQIRHAIYDMYKNSDKIDFYGSGCEKEIGFKIDGLRDYRYSIVIENSIESDYFTEKIIDCFLSGVIPVYWGTKNIGNYFDPNGIIFIQDHNELPSVINSLNEDFYSTKIESIKHNFEEAKKYIHPELIIQKFLNESL